MSEFAQTLRDLLSAGHAARFRASGDSMYPSIRSGDYLRIDPCGTSELRRGDVVLTAAARGLTAHRIVRIRERGGALQITTRGDNALRSDAPVEAGGVLGRVVWTERDRRHGAISEPAAILRIAAVLARRLRARFQQ